MSSLGAPQPTLATFGTPGTFVGGTVYGSGLYGAVTYSGINYTRTFADTDPVLSPLDLDTLLQSFAVASAEATDGSVSEGWGEGGWGLTPWGGGSTPGTDGGPFASSPTLGTLSSSPRLAVIA